MATTPRDTAGEATMAKAYDPAAHETRIYGRWEAQGLFKPETQARLGQLRPGATPFVISMPPPNVTGALHMGHALTAAMEDLMVRTHRLRGEPTLWVPGTDHAGIATQNVVERALGAEGICRETLGREAFVARVWQWKELHGDRITLQHRRLGVSVDWERERFTLDDGLSRAVAEAFVRLYERDLIYRGTYLVNWCPRCRSVISDIEVEHAEEVGTLYEFRYPLDGGGFIPVATTRPETILGDTAVAVHPEDERYRGLIGRTALVPMLERPIPVIADAYVDRAFGTGALKVTPGHDPNDYEIGRRHSLPELNVLNPDGTLNEHAGRYASLDRFEVRRRLWADMHAAGLVIGEREHRHSVGHCQRCHTIIEPLLSTQWFVRMQPLAEPAIAAVTDGRIRIVPERFTTEYFHWLENIRDWVISRQLWWGHRIPVWYGPDGHAFAGRTVEEARARARVQYGRDVPLTQDEDVLDTWFSSALWPFSTLGWPDQTDDLRHYYPTSVLETGYDILFFWVARMIFMGLAMTGDVPFRTVYLHGLIRDGQGRKMSKSLGNALDPLDLIERYGCDALRFTLVTGSTPGTDITLADERFEGGRNFANKLWNVGRFIVTNLEPDVVPRPLAELEAGWEALELADRWILSRHHRTVAEVTRLFDAYQFGEAGRVLYEFLWSELADWYVEACKVRLYGDDRAAAQVARQVLYGVLERSLALLHPFMPFVTEAIWEHLPKRPEAALALIVGRWPEPGRQDDTSEDDFALVQELVRGIRNARAEHDVEPGRRIAATVAGGARSAMLEVQAPLLAALARLDPAALRIEAKPAEPSEAHATVIAGEGIAVWLPLAGMVDLAKEQERLMAETAAARAEAARLRDILSNEHFVSRAPEAVVARERDRLAEAERRLAALQQKLAALN
jgi:valyl-tRNA synthetase